MASVSIAPGSLFPQPAQIPLSSGYGGGRCPNSLHTGTAPSVVSMQLRLFPFTQLQASYRGSCRRSWNELPTRWLKTEGLDADQSTPLSTSHLAKHQVPSYRDLFAGRAGLSESLTIPGKGWFSALTHTRDNFYIVDRDTPLSRLDEPFQKYRQVSITSGIGFQPTRLWATHEAGVMLGMQSSAGGWNLEEFGLKSMDPRHGERSDHQDRRRGTLPV